MPEINVYFFKDAKGNAHVLDWLKNLPDNVKEKAITRLLRLKQLGYEILENRKEAAYLRNEICELRWQMQNKHYRILFFFDGQTIAILSHTILKRTRKVPPKEINKAIHNKELYLLNREEHLVKIKVYQ